MIRNECSQEADVRGTAVRDARFWSIARLAMACCTCAAGDALLAANWTNLTVDSTRDGYWCSVAYSPSNHLPCVAYKGRVSPGGQDGLYYAEMVYASNKFVWLAPVGPLATNADNPNTSLAFNPRTGQPGVVYRSEFGQIHYIERSASGTWNIEVIDISGDNTAWTTVAFSPTTGRRAVAYHKAWGTYVKVNWYDERRDPDRNPDTGRQGWVTDNVGAGIWDFGNPSIAFSSEGLPAVSYYDGDWGLSVSMYNAPTNNWVISKLQLAGARLGGGNSSILFSPATDTPVVANVGYVIGGNGPVTLSIQSTNGWVTTDSGMLAYDDGGFASIAFDHEGRPTVVFVSGAVVLRGTIDNYLDPGQSEWHFDSVMMRQGIVQAFQAVQGPFTCIAVSGSSSLSSCLEVEMPKLQIEAVGSGRCNLKWTSAGADYDLLFKSTVPFMNIPDLIVRIDHSLSGCTVDMGANSSGFLQMVWPPR